MKQIRVLYNGRTGSGGGPPPPTGEQIDVVTPRGAVLHFTQGSATTVDQQEWSYLQRHAAYHFLLLDEPSAAPASTASAAPSARAPQASTVQGSALRTEETRHGG